MCSIFFFIFFWCLTVRLGVLTYAVCIGKFSYREVQMKEEQGGNHIENITSEKSKLKICGTFKLVDSNRKGVKHKLKDAA